MKRALVEASSLARPLNLGQHQFNNVARRDKFFCFFVVDGYSENLFKSHHQFYTVQTHSSYLLPGLAAGIAARSAGSASAGKASTLILIRLNSGRPKFRDPLERSTRIATPST